MVLALLAFLLQPRVRARHGKPAPGSARRSKGQGQPPYHEGSAVSTPRTLLFGSLIVIAIAVGACSSGSSGGAGPYAPATAAPKATVEARAATMAAGTVLVAGSNTMTVYTFAKDVAHSGTSACTGACLAKWPALTVPAGSTPVAGAGVTGTLGTITRTDDGTFQVTYNGLPLYFFANDKAPGDTNGNYTGWSLVKP